jgi:hypothetical protein
MSVYFHLVFKIEVIFIYFSFLFFQIARELENYLLCFLECYEH